MEQTRFVSLLISHVVHCSNPNNHCTSNYHWTSNYHCTSKYHRTSNYHWTSNYHRTTNYNDRYVCTVSRKETDSV